MRCYYLPLKHYSRYLKLQVLSLFLFNVLLLIGCYQEDSAQIAPLEIDSKKEVDSTNPLNNAINSRSSSSVIIISEGDFSGVIDTLTEQVLSYDVSQSYLASKNITFAQLDSILQVEMGSDYDFLFDDDIILNKPNFAECMGGCDENFRDEEGKKMKGYGRCRFRCWVDAAINLIDAIVPG